MRVTNLLVTDPLTSGRKIAASHLLALRVTYLIFNARLRWGGIDRSNPSLLLTLGPEAGIHPAMSYSHLARRISGRTRRLSAGVWDIRIG
jgi:hypothetical protein